MPKDDNNLPPVDRVVLRLRNGKRRVIDPADVYFLDASRGDTRVRMRGKKELIDVRRLDEIVAKT